MKSRCRLELESCAGAMLVEVLVATLLLLLVLASVFTLVASSGGTFKTQPEVIDLQQRLRVGIDMLRRDLLMAGAGPYAGEGAGTLIQYVAPVLPLKQGLIPALDDGPGTFRTSAITLFFVPATASQTTLVSSTDFNVVSVADEPGCPIGSPLCGFREGMQALLFDRRGAFDVVTLTRVVGSSAEFENNRNALMSRIHPAGTRIVEIRERVYYLDGATNRLMVYDGHRNTSPVLDNVVHLGFQYYGDPEPPQFRRPAIDQSTSYGPEPPPPDVALPGWPLGENCTFQMLDEVQQPRLAALGLADSAPVELTAGELTDGPWCPDAASPNRFDADLLRIRRIRVTLRVQTGDDALRGAATGGRDPSFMRAGWALSRARSVPDQTIQFDVSPRNLNAGR
jgi:hypothetical protein